MTDGENKPSMSYTFAILEESALLVSVGTDGKFQAVRQNESESVLHSMPSTFVN